MTLLLNVDSVYKFESHSKFHSLLIMIVLKLPGIDMNYFGISSRYLLFDGHFGGDFVSIPISEIIDCRDTDGD